MMGCDSKRYKSSDYARRRANRRDVEGNRRDVEI